MTSRTNAAASLAGVATGPYPPKKKMGRPAVTKPLQLELHLLKTKVELERASCSRPILFEFDDAARTAALALSDDALKNHVLAVVHDVYGVEDPFEHRKFIEKLLDQKPPRHFWRLLDKKRRPDEEILHFTATQLRNFVSGTSLVYHLRLAIQGETLSIYIVDVELLSCSPLVLIAAT